MLKLSFLNLFFSIFLVPLMMQCEDGQGGPCDTYTRYASEENLCELLPAKSKYSQGETATFTFAVKSKLSVDGKQTDIFQETKLDSGLLTVNLSELFKDNTVTFIKGQKIDDGKFKAVYNAVTDSYELEINVKLNRPGIYSFDSVAAFQDRDYNEESCIFIIVATNIKGSNPDDGRIKFAVI